MSLFPSRRGSILRNVAHLRLVLFALVLVVLAACKRAPPTSDVVLLPVVTDATTDVLLTWIAYPVRTMSRTEFEKLAVERRQKNGAVLTPKGADSAPPGAARPTVIIYGASWCGPCHQAAAYLKRRGVPFIEKDIEEDHGAAREMQAKLASAGMRGGSIPVMDVRGKLLIGFDERAVDRALGQTL
jgi:glutaredoxin